MPKSRKRKQTNYQRIQARNRKDTANLINHAFVMGIYAGADPQKQEYPPQSHRARAKAPKFKSKRLNYKKLASRVETFVEARTVKAGQRIETANGKTYEGQRDGSLRRVVVVRDEVRKAA